jgi:L-ascorbate metabolism protein UlaG (beta-lactamase superfamily)
MDIQFYGANCISLGYKNTRLVFDDNLSELGKKSVLKNGDVALFTTQRVNVTGVDTRLFIDSPGEYEISDISIKGIAARSHIDSVNAHNATMYKVSAGDISLLVTGHVYPHFNDDQLEAIGIIDVIVIPVGGHGYTLDPKGALTVIKELEPKLIIPTHYDNGSIKYPVPQLSLNQVLSELSMEPKETVAKLRIKAADLSDVAQLVILQTD